MASDARALCTCMCELLSAHSALSAEEGAELLRRFQEEFERHRTTRAVAIAFGRRPS
jgi:hypothetical protein